MRAAKVALRRKVAPPPSPHRSLLTPSSLLPAPTTYPSPRPTYPSPRVGGRRAALCLPQDEAYEFLTNGLPRQWRADATQLTRVGRLPSALELAALSPLQLAATLGDRALVRFILKKQ
jgi:hypothetical protein